MDITTASAEDVLSRIGSCQDGLDPGEARRRLAHVGLNQVDRVPDMPAWRRFLGSFTHFFALLLWLAAGMAIAAEIAQPGQGMGTLAAAVVTVILVNGLFAFWQDYRTERLLAALAQLLPQRGRVRRAGRALEIPIVEIVPGDVVLLGAGDIVPADCRLLRGFGVRVNSATVTGEALPQRKSAAPALEEDVLHSPNVLLAGTEVVSGEGEAVVFATGGRTEFGRLAHLAQTAGGDSSPFLEEIARVSRIIAVIAMSLGLSFFVIGLQAGFDLFAAAIFAIGIIVANVPEGLLPTVSLALAMGAQRMARRRVLIRHLPAVETLGAATVICTDKTGTLTENRMAVREVWLIRTRHAGPPERMLRPEIESDRRFLAVARWCQSLKPGARGRWLGDPMEIALVETAERLRPAAAEPRLLDELPFDAERRRMSVLRAEADGRWLYVKGAPEAVLTLATRATTNAGEAPLDEPTRKAVASAAADLATRGLRVLALAARQLEAASCSGSDEADLLLLGLVGLHDPPRAGVADAVAAARAAGIKVIMTTGDHPSTALAIARQIGLVTLERPTIVTGERLRQLSEAQLRLILDAPEPLFARLGADQKLRVVRALRALRHVVAVTGDGVNDAPALREAEIGIAMGRSGSDVAREAADIVLVDDNFADIVAAIEEGRAVFANVRKFMTYILTSNIPEIVPYLAFVLLGIPLPLTIAQILAVDLGTDIFPALALGAERPDPAMMRRPPRRRSDRLLDRPLLLRAYLFLGLFEAAAAMLAYFAVLHEGGWRWGEVLGGSDPLYLAATTACLCGIVVTQMVNLFLCRSEHRSAFSRAQGRNPWLLAGLAAEALLVALIVYTPSGNLLFGTTPIGIATWVPGILVALVMLAAEEARKAWLRHRGCQPARVEAEAPCGYRPGEMLRSPGSRSTQDRSKAASPSSR